jgi:hypothetical protein
MDAYNGSPSKVMMMNHIKGFQHGKRCLGQGF